MNNFKKYIFIAAALILSAQSIFAQNENPADETSDLEQRISNLEAENEKYRAESEAQEISELRKFIWGKGRYTRIGFAWAQTAPENSAVYKGKFGISLTKGVTYRILPTKPIANCIVFGIDATWIDIQFAKYKDPYDVEGGNWTSDFVEEDDPYDDEDGGDFNFNIGHLSLSASLGVGPSVTVAPFVFTGIKGLMPLKAQLYFHYNPTFMAYMASQNGDIEFSGAFVNMFSFGGNLTYRWIGLGVEGRWGSGKFSPVSFDEGAETEKYKRKFANTRLYVQFTF